MKIRSYQHSRNKRKNLIASLVLKPRDLIVTILMLNIFVNIMVQNFASNIFGTHSGWLLKVGVPLLITLLFGEVIPKSIALHNNERISPYVAPIIAFLRSLFTPLRIIIIFITGHISRTLFFFLRKGKEISKEELHYVLKTSQHRGVLADAEEKLVKGYLNLQDATVKELMQPREDIIYYDLQDPVDTIPTLFITNNISRILVCNMELDNISGIISARDFLPHRHEIVSPEDVRRFLRNPYFAPETMPARMLWKYFEQQGLSIAVIVDEYGSISGVITREDLYTVVIGRFAEAHDHKPLFTKAGDDIIIASGKLELTEFAEIFGTPLNSENNMVTIGGWLTEQLGDIPKTGTQYTTEHFLFQILASNPNRVRRIYIRKLSDGK